MKLSDIQNMVQKAIDNGASTVEEVHKSNARTPWEQLQKLGPMEGVAKGAQDLQDDSIGKVYETLRQVNQQVGDVAGELLKKIEVS